MDGTQTHKMSILSCHDNTITGFMTAIDKPDILAPPFASHLTLEIGHENGFYLSWEWNGQKQYLDPVSCDLDGKCAVESKYGR